MNLIKDHVFFSILLSCCFWTVSLAAFKNWVTDYIVSYSIFVDLPTFFFFFYLDPFCVRHPIPRPLPIFHLFSVHSLFSVFKGGLRYLRPLRQAFSKHADIVLWGPAHQPSDTQLPHWRRGPVHAAASAVHQRSFAVPVGPLWLEPICLPLRHRQR